MDQRPLHWSEKARMYPPPNAPLGGGAPRPGKPGRKPQPGRRPPKRGGTSKGFWVTIAVVVVLAAAAAVVWFWYLPSRDAETADVPTTVVAASTTSAPAITSTISATTTTASGAPAPELAKSYASPSLGSTFNYPGSWVEYAPEIALGTSVDDPTVFIVGDPSSEAPAGIPNDFVMFMGERWPGQTAPAPRTTVDTMVADFQANHPASTQLYESAHDFQVNGLPACSWATRDQGSLGAGITKTVYVSAGDGLYMFSFWSIETRLPQNQAFFDAILSSFRPPSANQ